MNDPSPKSRLPSILLIVVLSALALAGAWYFRPAPIQSSSVDLVSQSAYSVQFEGLGIFYLPSASLGEGLVFYPGARVPPEAYAWLGSGLAAKGHPVFIVRFPFNFAVFAPGRAEAVLKAHLLLKNLTYLYTIHTVWFLYCSSPC